MADGIRTLEADFTGNAKGRMNECDIQKALEDAL